MSPNQYAGRCGCGTYVRPRQGFYYRRTPDVKGVRCKPCAEASKEYARTARLPYKDD